MGIREGCTPRREVLKGDLQDAIFGADFADVIADRPRAPEVYADARTFFANTHPATRLRELCRLVFTQLANRREGGVSIRLSTGFGGGKTHALLALWHLAKHIAESSMGTDLLPAAGRPQTVNVAAIDASKAGVEEFAAHGQTTVRSLWGELFYCLGGKQALKSLGSSDQPEASPGEHQIEAVLPKGPVLILLDELVVYMAKLSERGQGNLLGFVTALTAIVARRPQTVLIVTDPAGQAAYATESKKISDQALGAARRLDDVLSRKGTDFDPIGDESAQVIVRRLLERRDNAEAQNVSAIYHRLYERVLSEHPGLLHSDALRFAERIVTCYPFHPRLLDSATNRLGALGDFQKSRGVLRLFARIIRDVWESDADPALITAGEIDWMSPRIQGDLLDRLNRPEFKAAIRADIQGHASELDGSKPGGIHQRVASAIMLDSIPMDAHAGLEPADLTLAVLGPDEAGPEPTEAMDRLMGRCWHTYPTESGRGCQFRYQPNVLKQIEAETSNVPIEDARDRVRAEARAYFSGPTFQLVPWPASPKQVTNSASLQLVLSDDESLAKRVVALEDDSNPAAPVPRAFQNAIVAVAPTAASLSNSIERARRLMAAERINRASQKADDARLVREQLKRIEPMFRAEFERQTRRAFSIVVLPGGVPKSLEERYQVPLDDDSNRQRATGQANLSQFLIDKNLIYGDEDALDPDRFVSDILKGATPTVDRPDVYTAKAIHERLLAAPGLRLIRDRSFVLRTIVRAVDGAKVAIRLESGRAFDQRGAVDGSAGRRHRIVDDLRTFPLDDTTLIAPLQSPVAQEWLRVDALEAGKDQRDGATDGDGPAPPPPPAGDGMTVQSWDDLIQTLAERPLRQLELTARTPTDAANLLTQAQPLGADRLSLEVYVGGSLKEGGSVNFKAGDIKHNHAIKPLEILQRLWNATADEQRTCEVTLRLTFASDRRRDLSQPLQRLYEAMSESRTIKVKGCFDRPTEVLA